SEQMLPRPYVGAVGGDHEGEIAEEPHSAHRLARGLPLLVRPPLHVLMEQHFLLEIAPRVVQRGSVAASKRLRPVKPRRAPVSLAQRAVESVVGEPPLFP